MWAVVADLCESPGRQRSNEERITIEVDPPPSDPVQMSFHIVVCQGVMVPWYLNRLQRVLTRHSCNEILVQNA